MPPLEAMKCGAPVIVGNKTSLPEVVGDAGVLVDPFDVDDIAAAIEKVISDSNLRAQLRVKGLERARILIGERLLVKLLLFTRKLLAPRR